MVNILFIAYEFPPLNRGGTQRPLKFVKYLKESGINPIVLTLHPESYPLVYDQFHLDEETFLEINEVADIHLVKSDNIIKKYQGKLNGFLSIYFSLVQKEAEGWRPYLLPVIERIMAEKNIQAIYATAPPFSIAPLAAELAKRYHLPLILDLRDAWSQWIMQPYGSYLHYRLLLRLERKCLKAATAIVGTSDQTISDFKELHPQLSPEKFHLIPNGYDENVPDFNIKPPRDSGKFRIGYVGSFYYNPISRKKLLTPWWKKKGHHLLAYAPQQEDWLYRSPYFFFRALAALREAAPEAFHKVEVVFAGSVPEWLPGMIVEFSLQDQVQLMGRINHQESLAFQKQCDALLLTSSRVIGGEDYSIAGKTFEYITMGKPILAFVAEGAQKRLMQQTGLAVICDPDEVEKSAFLLADLMDGKISFKPNVPFLRSLHRKELSKKLAGLIHQLVK